MIKIVSPKIDEMKNMYVSEIMKVISEKWRTKGVPVTNSIGLINKLYSTEYPDIYIKDIVSMKMNNLMDKYEEIRSYFEICRFISSQPLERSKCHPDRSNREMNRDKRCEILSEIEDNEIYKLATNHISLAYHINSDIKFSELITILNNFVKNINSDIAKFIDYSFLQDWLRHSLLVGLDIEVCPYCNRQFISKYTKSDILLTTADLDHFYNKGIYNLFSLSFYNFIPSCPICNSKFKGDKGKLILYPYEDSFHEHATFYIEFDTLDEVYKNNYELKINVTNENEKVWNSMSVFCLESIYQNHKNYVSELVYKKTKYSSKGYNELLVNLFDGENLSTEQMNIFLYGHDFILDNLYKRPLSLITYQIINNK